MLVLTLLASPADAAVRLFNGTDQPLVVDILHADHQQRDVKLPVGTALSEKLGTDLAQGETEMLVVRDASGKELVRKPVTTDGIYALNARSGSVLPTYLGNFQNEFSNGDSLFLVNSTGAELQYAIELADFTKREGKGGSPSRAHAVGMIKLAHIGKQGEKRSLTLSAPGIEPRDFDVTLGVPIQVTVVGGALELTPLR